MTMRQVKEPAFWRDGRRIVYHDDTANGAVEAGEILDENHYYAYGMEYVRVGYINSTGYAYKFNDD